MSERKSLATRLYEAILEKMESEYEILLKAFTPPFLHEEVDKATFRRNFDSMTEAQRVELIAKMGSEKILEALSKKGGQDGGTAMET